LLQPAERSVHFAVVTRKQYLLHSVSRAGTLGAILVAIWFIAAENGRREAPGSRRIYLGSPDCYRYMRHYRVSFDD
jgi:hypothetical protein